MSNSLLLESAVRTLLMGALICLSLRLLKVRAVRAQRAAWLLALAASLAMPAIVAFGWGPRLLPAPAAIDHAQPLIIGTSARLVTSPAAAAVSHRSVSAPDPVQSVWPSVLRDAYLFIAATLLLQLVAGLAIAWHIRAASTRVACPNRGISVRTSLRVATPVTIASTVILPADYRAWSDETFDVVLSHESAHIRQRDFWVRLLAQVHCAVFWFNPFAWWLKRQLAELGEALSDHAATQVAGSHASYAELLLNFARRARWPHTMATFAGVCMAHSSNLSSRIDRLLSEQRFKRAFSDSPRGVVLALLVSLGAMCAASATMRVQAAAKAAPPPVVAVAAPSSPVPPASAVDPPPPPPAPPAHTGQDIYVSEDSDGEGVLAIHVGDSITMWNDFDDHFAKDFVRAHPDARGDYIYFRQNGRGYLVQDPQLLSRARQMLAPAKDLRRKQEDLSRRQRAEADRQRDIGREERDVSIEAPDFKNEIARLNKVADEMRAAQSAAQMKPEQIARLQAELGDIQGNLGALEGRANAAAAQFGVRQAAAGERQARLGEEQAELGEARAKVIEQARQNLTPLIERAIREGAVAPLD